MYFVHRIHQMLIHRKQRGIEFYPVVAVDVLLTMSTVIVHVEEMVLSP